MIPKGVLRYAEFPTDKNKSKILTSKLCHFWPKTLDLPQSTNYTNRISVSEHVLLDTFWASQWTKDKEIAQKSHVES